MKNLKTYKMFESSGELTPEQVEWLDQCTSGTWQLNPSTGEVDVDGEFSCREQGLSDFKGVRFGVVEVHFSCNDNQLTTLEGAPRKVGESFYCYNNQLTSLEGAPQKVGGSFYCNDNQLTTLEGAPREVGEDFWCENNQLTSLEGAPREVRKNFYCRNNQLTSLEGAPQVLGMGFYCQNNQLTTLEGAPQEVGGCFYCGNNQLSTLEGAPRKVGGYGFSGGKNPVSSETLETIFSIMEEGKSYLEAVESLWKKIPPEDQILLYRPGFKWVTPEKKRAAELIVGYNRIKEML